MILLWGLPRDAPLAAVRDVLHRQGLPSAFLNQQAVLDTAIELQVGSDVEGVIRTSNQTIDLGTVTAVYLRPHDSRRLAAVKSAGEGSSAWWHALGVEDTLLSWVELTSALVVNRPTAMASNSSKPYQAAQIQSLGFKTPPTLITTDPQAAHEFWTSHSTVIYKSISGVRSIVSRLTPEHVERLDDIVWCPTQFQQYILGNDYRVHVVGDEVFACVVVSEADDYRYAARQRAAVEIRPCDLPDECVDQCRKLAAAMDLIVAGIDLRLTPDGTWYCFEVNPSPGFTYYQEATNQRIDEAIARILATGNKYLPSGIRRQQTDPNHD
jgi:predicted ATP-grasp superfamily ATP-dependent carboligase